MPRKPTKTESTAQVVTDADTPGLPAMVDAANVLAAVQVEYNEERDLVNQLLGQAQMADAFEQFSRTVRTSKLAFVRENKLYRALKGMKTANGSLFSGTWEEFCQLLGTSRDKVELDITNLRAFGEEALDSMSRMGIGYRELRQFRRLPEDQKTALLEVAKTGDKDAFLELAEDLIAKHAKEKEALAQRVEEVESDLASSREVSEGKSDKINQLTKDLTKTKERVKKTTPPDVGEEIRQKVTQLAAQAEVCIIALRPGLEALAEHTGAHGITHDDFVAGLICQLELTLRKLRGEFNVKAVPDGDDTPEWMRPGADEAAAALIAKQMAAAGWKRDNEGRMVPAAAEEA